MIPLITKCNLQLSEIFNSDRDNERVRKIAEHFVNKAIEELQRARTIRELSFAAKRLSLLAPVRMFFLIYNDKRPVQTYKCVLGEAHMVVTLQLCCTHASALVGSDEGVTYNAMAIIRLLEALVHVFDYIDDVGVCYLVLYINARRRFLCQHGRLVHNFSLNSTRNTANASTSNIKCLLQQRPITCLQLESSTTHNFDAL